MVDFLPIILLSAVVLLAVGQLALAVYLRGRQEEFITELAKVFGLSERQERGWNFWHKMMGKAEKVLGEAELEGVKVVAGAKYYTKELEDVYTRELTAASGRIEKALEREIVDRDRQMTELVDGAMEAFTRRLEEIFFAEERKAREEVAAYKKRAVEKVRADLEEILDRVVQETLGKRLPESSQEELINEAFEQAKKEKFL